MTRRLFMDPKVRTTVEAALNHAMDDEEWLQSMVDDDDVPQNTVAEVYQNLEHYITDTLYGSIGHVADSGLYNTEDDTI